jgi:Taurine catabolism dioxygenase TauD, TfdA family
MIGIFVERDEADYAVRRQAVLKRREWYPSPDRTDAQTISDGDVLGCSAYVRTALRASGLAWIELDRALTNKELVELAKALGRPLKQPNPRTQPWVDEGVILNLRADHEETNDLEWGLLFSKNYVMLHTELAARPVKDQPQYIIFHCIEPPQQDAGGQTILISMENIRSALSRRQASIMRQTHHARYADVPRFLRCCGVKEIFAFKDLGGQDLVWRYEGDDRTVTSQEVNAAIAALLSSLYQPSGIIGFHWKRWALGIFDNTRYFHGRTFIHGPSEGPARHLRRVRISTGYPPQGGTPRTDLPLSP